MCICFWAVYSVPLIDASFLVLAMPGGMWDPSSPTRDQTRPSVMKAWRPNHCTAGEFPPFLNCDKNIIQNEVIFFQPHFTNKENADE